MHILRWLLRPRERLSTSPFSCSTFLLVLSLSAGLQWRWMFRHMHMYCICCRVA